MISIIVAASNNNVIGAQGKLPWHLSSDLKRFKALTMGKPGSWFRPASPVPGRPLPGRQNIVVTRQAAYTADGCDVVQSIDAAVAAAGDAREIMIIGGSHIYQEFLPRAERIYLTRVQTDVEGDVFLPELVADGWREITREERAADESNDYDVVFLRLDRSI